MICIDILSQSPTSHSLKFDLSEVTPVSQFLATIDTAHRFKDHVIAQAGVFELVSFATVLLYCVVGLK